jgi:nicotinate-nucleotide adenylyltransferase
LKLGVLGGTFDPPHIGHLILAEEARLSLGLGQVLFVPAGAPWRKAGQELSAREDRLAMVRLAVGDNPDFAVSSLEVEREGPSYTAETLAELCAQLGRETEFFFIMGGDSLVDFPHWHEPQRILELAYLAVAERPEPEDVGLGESLAEEVAEAMRQRVVWLRMPRIDVSATAVRERVRRGLSIRYWVPLAVEKYIREHGLYVGG